MREYPFAPMEGRTPMSAQKRHPSEKAMKPVKKNTRKPSKGTAVTGKKPQGFTDEERVAMRERAQELKAEARRGSGTTDGESDVLAKIAEMEEPDRTMAERIHTIIKT